MTSRTALDENGEEVVLNYQLDDMGSFGQRITTAWALAIADDVLSKHPHQWTDNDIAIALRVIRSIRAQQGITGPDADALGEPDGLFATHQIDIWVYG